MGKAISLDMRVRMVRGIASGKSRRAVAAQFEVAPSTAVRLQKRLEQTGSIEPSPRGRAKNSGKLGPHRAFLIAIVEAQPDITMPALACRLEDERGVKADPSNLSKLLCREGYSFKKNASGVGERTRRHPSSAH